MKRFYGVFCATLLTASFSDAQQTQGTTYVGPADQVVTIPQPVQAYPSQVYIPQGAGTVVQTPANLPAGTVVQQAVPQQPQPGTIVHPGTLPQTGYQYQNAPVVQSGDIVPPPTETYAQDYLYGQSSVQYSPAVVPVKPFVPYSELSPPQNAYPLSPFTPPDVNQVNQQFLQRYSQQNQDYIRSQFGYTPTFIDPNAGKPALGKPIRFSDPTNLSKIKKGSGKMKITKAKALYKSPEVPTYFFPGMVALTKRLWVGSDYLFYVPSSIGVVIELIADKQIRNDEGKVLVEEEKLKKIVENIFRNGGITPQSYSVENAAPLPFFHILIMMYHVDNKVFASVSGRLFEEALPARLDLDAPVGTFQAITWEKNELLIVSKLQAPEQFEAMLTNIATTFVNGYHEFTELELDAISPDDLRDN